MPGIWNQVCCRARGKAGRRAEPCLFFAPFDLTRATGITYFFAAASPRRPCHALNFKSELAELWRVWMSSVPSRPHILLRLANPSQSVVCSPISGRAKEHTVAKEAMQQGALSLWSIHLHAWASLYQYILAVLGAFEDWHCLSFNYSDHHLWGCEAIVLCHYQW